MFSVQTFRSSIILCIRWILRDEKPSRVEAIVDLIYFGKDERSSIAAWSARCDIKFQAICQILHDRYANSVFHCGFTLLIRRPPDLQTPWIIKTNQQDAQPVGDLYEERARINDGRAWWDFENGRKWRKDARVRKQI